MGVTLARRVYARHRAAVGYLLLVAYVTVVAAVAVDASRDADRDINRNRVEVARDACRDQNSRREATIRQLDAVIASRAAVASPARRERLRERRDQTVLLIDALAPRRDCRALVEQIRATG